MAKPILSGVSNGFAAVTNSINSPRSVPPAGFTGPGKTAMLRAESGLDSRATLTRTL